MSKKGLQQIGRSIKGGLIKKSPEILVGFGIGGMFIGAIMAVKETPKAMRILEEAEAEKLAALPDDAPEEEAKLTKKEVVKLTWKTYAPAAGTMLVSAGLVIAGCGIGSKRTAALATAYKLSESYAADYRDKVIEAIGEQEEQNIRRRVNKERMEKDPKRGDTIIFTDKGDVRCYDALGGRYFSSNKIAIEKAVNTLNKRMLSEIYIPLNDFYDELGLEATKHGDMLGWNLDIVGNGMIEVDMNSAGVDEDGVPYLIVDYLVAPRYEFDKLA